MRENLAVVLSAALSLATLGFPYSPAFASGRNIPLKPLQGNSAGLGVNAGNALAPETILLPAAFPSLPEPTRPPAPFLADSVLIPPGAFSGSCTNDTRIFQTQKPEPQAGDPKNAIEAPAPHDGLKLTPAMAMAVTVPASGPERVVSVSNGHLNSPLPGGKATALEPKQWNLSDVLQKRLAQPFGPGVWDGQEEFSPLPRGVQTVVTYSVHSSHQLYSLLHEKIDKDTLSKLKRAIAQRGPLQIFHYTDALGGHFMAIDVSDNAWIDHLPLLESDEKEALRRIRFCNRNIQVLLRENGKTPDLLVGGRLTELKAVTKRFWPQLLRANRQVIAFADRHRLGGGDAALYLKDEETVPVDFIAQRINSWVESLQEEEIGLERIWVYSKNDAVVFLHQEDGSFRIGDSSRWDYQGEWQRPLPAN